MKKELEKKVIGYYMKIYLMIIMVSVLLIRFLHVFFVKFDLGSFDQGWAMICSAIFATIGVSVTVNYQKNSDKNKNAIEYITNSRIEWSYKIRDITSNIVKVQKDIDILALGMPLYVYGKGVLSEIEKDINSKMIELSYLISELIFHLNPIGEIDKYIIGWIEVLRCNNDRIYAKIREIQECIDGNIDIFKIEAEEYKINDEIIKIIIKLVQLYLKLEWERVKKEVNEDRSFKCEDLIKSVFDSLRNISCSLKLPDSKQEMVDEDNINKHEEKIIDEYKKYFT